VRSGIVGRIQQRPTHTMSLSQKLPRTTTVTLACLMYLLDMQGLPDQPLSFVPAIAFTGFVYASCEPLPSPSESHDVQRTSDTRVIESNRPSLPPSSPSRPITSVGRKRQTLSDDSLNGRTEVPVNARLQAASACCRR